MSTVDTGRGTAERGTAERGTAERGTARQDQARQEQARQDEARRDVGRGEVGRDGAGLTVGVEEEFLLLDPRDGHNLPVAADVLAALPDDVRPDSRVEFRPSMVELATPVRTTLSGLADELHRLRRAAAATAEACGAHLVPIGATPVAEPDRGVSDDPRFHAIVRHYGPIARDASVCGCHVHVGMPDRATAVAVGNHLRPWLPVVQALTVNSPFYLGTDTGHASWRSMQLERWPSLGPTPYCASEADFDRQMGTLVASGAMLDDSMVLWYVRPSRTYPTVEVRVSDVCATVGETVLTAGLVRALVATALDDIARVGEAPRLTDLELRAAHWNAAHQGMTGTLLHPRGCAPIPAWDLVDELLDHLGPALRRCGDEGRVLDEVARVRRDGTAAERLRRAWRRTGDIGAAVAQGRVRP